MVSFIGKSKVDANTFCMKEKKVDLKNLGKTSMGKSLPENEFKKSTNGNDDNKFIKNLIVGSVFSSKNYLFLKEIKTLLMAKTF